MSGFVRFIEESKNWTTANRGQDIMRFAAQSFQSCFGVDSGCFLFKKRETRLDIDEGSWALYEPWGTFAQLYPKYRRFHDLGIAADVVDSFLGQWIGRMEWSSLYETFPNFGEALRHLDLNYVGGWPLALGSDLHGVVVLGTRAHEVPVSADIIGGCAAQIMTFLETIRIRFRSEVATSVVENSVDAICALELDGTVIDINKACQKLFGWTREELVGVKGLMASDDLGKEFFRFVKDSRDAALHRTVRGLIRRRDGTACPVMVTFFGLRNPDDSLSLVAAILKDMTEIDELNNSLIEARYMYEGLFNHSADAIMILDEEGRIERVNPAYETLFGWCAHESLGKYPNSIPPDQLSDFLNDLRSVVQDGRQIVGQRTERWHRDGTLMNVSSTLSPIVDKAGVIRGVSMIIRDVSAEVEAEEQIRKADKLALAGTLAASVAHEIRNPLTTVKGFLRLMQEDLSHRSRDYRLMESEILQMEQIINEFLLLAKPSHTTLSHVDIPQMMADVVTLLSGKAHMHGVEIEFKAGDYHPKVLCDPVSLKQVFVNLLKNSVEALELQYGGTVRIEVGFDANLDQIIVRFEDDGPGMTSEQIERIGEPFYTTKDKGTGLGMMVCRRIVLDLNGSLDVDSEIGRGTTVVVRLPAMPGVSA